MSEKKMGKAAQKKQSLNGWLDEDRRKRREEKKRDAALRKFGASILDALSCGSFGRTEIADWIKGKAEDVGLLPEVESK